jgi:hypothetical protein
MTECAAMWTLATVAECEQRPDRLAELSARAADLLIETRKQRATIIGDLGGDNPRVREALARLAKLELSLEELGAQAASVERLLQHVQ